MDGPMVELRFFVGEVRPPNLTGRFERGDDDFWWELFDDGTRAYVGMQVRGVPAYITNIGSGILEFYATRLPVRSSREGPIRRFVRRLSWR